MLAVIIGAIVGNTQAYSFGRWFGQKNLHEELPLPEAG